MKKTACLLVILITAFFTKSSVQNNQVNNIETYRNKEISFEILEQFLKQQMNELDIPAISIAIINDGEVVYTNAFGVANTETNNPINQNSIFESASLSKPVFAFFVMKLSEKGIIDLDRPLHYYLPDKEMEKDQRYKFVTARMVLSHCTGFPNWRWFDKPPKGMKVNKGDFFMVNDPNMTFNYSGEAYQYLARVVAHLNYLNMYELDSLFREEVAVPLKMEHAYFVWDDYLYENRVSGHVDGKPRKMEWGTALPHQNSKVLNAAGGLRTEANSYGNFLISIINGIGLYPETYQEMLRPYTEIPSNNSNYREDSITHWSMGFGIKPMKNDTIYRHGGSNSDFQSEFAFSVKKKYGYVFFVNCDKGNDLNEKIEQFLELKMD